MFSLSDILHPLNVLGSAPAVLGNTTVVRFSVADPTISLACTGDIIIRSTKAGQPVVATYSDLPLTNVSIQADANTDITIIGDVTGLGLNYTDVNYYWSNNTALLEIGCASCMDLTSLDVSGNTALQRLGCDTCTGLTMLDLSANTELLQLNCQDCSGLTTLDLSTNTVLTELYCSTCTGLTTIKYPATNNDVSAEIASAITNATAADGTVYTDSAADYYSTIATAANNKGWTIAQL